MKRIILLTIFLLSILSVYATHEYIPLLSPDNVWVESCYQAYAQYAISDRIDINGVEYCVVSRTEMSLPDKDIVANNKKLYIREEGKRVYRYDDAFAQECLLFDFGVKEGDIIDSSISSENKRHIVVDSIRSVMLDAKEHNAYYVTYFVNEGRFLNDIWIEGIGSTQTFLFNDVIRWGGSGYSYFNYFYNKNTQYIYPEDATLYDFGTSSTHEYIPYVQEGNAWAFLNSVEMGVFQYSIGETKEIDGKQYHIIYETFYNAMIGQAQMPREYGYIHEENGKVYCGTGNNERLIYDFTLQKGDSVYWGQEWYSSFGYDKYVYVKDVNYIQIAGKERKVMTVETRGIVFSGDVEEGPDFDEIWIEGIGSTETVYANESSRWLTGLVGNYWRFSYYYNYPTQTSYPEDATLYDFGFPTTDEYIPYVREGNAWVIIGGEGYKQFSIGQEVVIDNKSYYELNYAFFKPSKGCVTNRSLYDYIWERDKKVYLGTETQNRLLYDFGAQVLDTIRYDHLDESFYYYTVVNSVSTQEILGKQRLVMNVSHYCSVDDFNDPIQSSWIEGIGAINEDIFDFEKSYRMGASATPDQFYYYTNSNEGGCYPEVQKVIDFSAISTVSTDTSTLTLHRSGDVLMATFPTVGKGEAITLYDATGRVVTTQPIREGATTTSIDVATLPDGIYIARLSSGSTAKVVL